MSDPYKNDEELVDCIAAAFSHEDAVRYVGEFRAQFVNAERTLIRADVEALTEAWKRGDNVEVSRLLVKLRDA